MAIKIAFWMAAFVWASSGSVKAGQNTNVDIRVVPSWLHLTFSSQQEIIADELRTLIRGRQAYYIGVMTESARKAWIKSPMYAELIGHRVQRAKYALFGTADWCLQYKNMQVQPFAFPLHGDLIVLTRPTAVHALEVCLPTLREHFASLTAQLQACLYRTLPTFKVYTEDCLKLVNRNTWQCTTTSTGVCRSNTGEECRCQSPSTRYRPYPLVMDVDERNESNNSRCHVTNFPGNRSYNNHARPAVLYTIPGSGNTFVRHLIERSTGYYTGSLYHDRSLKSVLPAEGHCRNTIAVKAHPEHYNFTALFGSDVKVNAKCDSLDSALVVIRDPYHAIFANFQRQTADKAKENSHVALITTDAWTTQRATRFRKYAIRTAQKMASQWELDYLPILEWSRDRQLFVRFEDLTNKSTRAGKLAEIAQWLVGESDPSRTACAFEHAANPATYRPKPPNAMTAERAFDRKLSCQVWTVIRSYWKSFGYTPIHGPC